MAPVSFINAGNITRVVVWSVLTLFINLKAVTDSAIVCEGWCYPSGVCQSSGTQCGCNGSSVRSTCAFRVEPDPHPSCANACNNGGTCIVHNGLPLCVCNNHLYYGSTCQYVRSETCSKECLNGGNCQKVKTDGMNETKEMCACSAQYYGDSCQYHATDCPQPCLNGGVCQWGYCRCTANYTGNRCQIPWHFERCSTYYCLNGGTCVEDFALYPSCLCPNGYQGKKCDEPVVGYYDGRKKRVKHLSAGNIAAIVIIVFATMGLSIGVKLFRKWKIRRIRDRRRQNQTLNNRAWIERSSPHSGVNFVNIPDFLQNHDLSPSQTNTTPSDITPTRSYSCSSTAALTANQNVDNSEAMAPEELPPPYDSVVHQNFNMKSNVRFQELNCRNLDDP